MLDSVKFAGECIELLVFKCFSVCFERLDVKTSSRIDEPFNISHLEFMISFSSSTSFLLLLPFSNSFFKWVYMSVSNYFIPIFIISIYQGVRPPENSVVKYIKYEILFRHGKSFLCRTYAVIVVKNREIIVPTAVITMVTTYELIILCGFSKIVL